VKNNRNRNNEITGDGITGITGDSHRLFLGDVYVWQRRALRKPSIPASISAAPAGVAYTYDGAGQLVTKTGPDGEPWSFGYDARGNAVSSEDPPGNESTMVYDDF
jgi:YD repeat-containing protein